VMTVLRLDPDAIAWREVDGEILALDIAASMYLSTTPAGATLWRALARGASRDDLVELLLAEFDVDEARATTDVEAFVAELAAHGLLAA
jgi:Coenzyme PQQ synthesis protein D (PqqD)